MARDFRWQASGYLKVVNLIGKLNFSEKLSKKREKSESIFYF